MTHALAVAALLALAAVLSRATPARAGVATEPGAAASAGGYDWAKWKAFWSFKPVERPAPPAVRDAAWVRNPVDAFVLAKLEAEGLTPAAEAERAVLIRRLTFDLTGLPPLPDEVRAFQRDKSPDAYEKLVDRLLASPHYGERWGRHWLDVARYVPGRVSFPGIKDTAGDAAYRDYVVRALNKDKPFDAFLVEQLAGDLLPPAAERERHFDQITAPAFLSIGAWFDQCTDPNRLRLEMIDEMVNATTQAFMGLSVSCARCHDHKFDPIPTEDYYALGGIFRSSRIVGDFSEYWRDGRVRQLRPLAMPDEVAANDAIRGQIAAKKQSIWATLTQEHARLLAAWKADEPRYRAAAAGVGAADLFVHLFDAENFDGQDNLRIAQLMRDGRGVEIIETQTPLAQWVKYKLEIPEAGRYRLEALYASEDASPLLVQVNGKTVTDAALAEPTGGWDLTYQRWREAATFDLRGGLNFVRLWAKAGNFPRIDRFRLVRVDDALDARVRETAASRTLHRAILGNFVKDPQHPWPTIAEIGDYLEPASRESIARSSAEIDALAKTLRPYPLVVAVTDQPAAVDLPVHVKGDTYKTTAKAVPRGVLRVFDDALPRPSISQGGSGRLELARWLTDRRHPLTARVMANRIWHGHFGRGIVKTTSDFGSRGDPPTHPELLDWLAAEFMNANWSMKHLHRLIVTSSTYRMSSDAPDAVVKRDPENKLLARQNRRRLEAEAVYDAMRSTTNMIPRQEPGRPLDVDKSKDRAMYVLTSNRSPKGLGAEVRKFFPLFDYEMSGVPLPARPASTTPAQSLFFMNNPLAKYMADRFAERLIKMDKLDDPKRLEMAYLLALGRPPSKEMASQALSFIEQCTTQQGMTRVEAWSKLCQAIYGTAEFRYVD